MQLCGWTNTRTGEIKQSRDVIDFNKFAFSGIQIINTRIFSLMTGENRFSLTDLYLGLASHHSIVGYPETGQVWRDVGTLSGS
jgi:NDP-sugar pyrophosphorylase family protein